jgi:hypothetical protein
MALTDNERVKAKKRDKKRPIDAKTNLAWSDSQKLEAIHAWLTLGNLALTSRITGIPEITLRVWKTSEWWRQTVDDIRLQDNIQLSARMRKLVEASQQIVAQRLETGDPILNQKTGEIVYKPVSLKDAHKVSIDLIDRKQVLDKITTDTGPTEERNDDKLQRLAERFAEMATKSIEKKYNKQRTVDVTDVEEVSSAVDEERETGLQEGVRSLPGKTGPD